MKANATVDKSQKDIYYLIHRPDCRVCGSTDLQRFLHLGDLPLVNEFVAPEDVGGVEPRFPLDVYFCRSCSLVQLLDVVHHEYLFEEYVYSSSASKPLVRHFARQAQALRDRYLHSPDDLVVEFGSNDGVFLQNYIGQCRILGVDSAMNIAALAIKKGVPTLVEFFNEALAQRIRKTHGPAQVVFAANVFAHNDDVLGLARGAAGLLADEGVFVFEVHWFADFLATKCFDQFYHEHLCYYSLGALHRLMEQAGLRIIDVNKIPIHGTSLQVHAVLEGATYTLQPSVRALLDEEHRMGLTDEKVYLSYCEEVESIKTRLVELLAQLKSEGNCIVGYGAPGKGNTLLNYCGIGKETLSYLIDTTPFKQGMYTPGTHIPVYPPEKLNEDRPDYALLLAWNYADAILAKEQALREAGMKFIIPVPFPKVV